MPLLRMFLAPLLIFLCTSRCDQALLAKEIEFRAVQLSPASRIDALAFFGKGVVLAGTRDPQPGYIHMSNDYGLTWKKVGNVTGSDIITCLSSGTNGVGYLLTGEDVHVWKTADYGESWKDLGQVSKASNPIYANAYGMLVTSKGTLLVADADSDGGRIHRSLDAGGTWQNSEPVSNRPLYRLLEVGDGVIANGWAGHVYKTTDEGATWNDIGKLIDSELYAIEYLGGGKVLIASESGNVFTSDDNGSTWRDQGFVAASGDDFAWLGGNRALYSTYAGHRHVYLSDDYGKTWVSIGHAIAQQPDDWLDHIIYISENDVRCIVAGTGKGYILSFDLSDD